MPLVDDQMSDAAGSAEFVAKGEVRPHKLLELAIAQQEAIIPRLDAVIESSEGEARKPLTRAVLRVR